MSDMPKTIAQTCTFETKRLQIKPWKSYAHSPEKMKAFAQLAVQMLSPEVTKDLPTGWQQIETHDDANAWAKERDEESAFLVVQDKDSETIIGLLFLYESQVDKHDVELRLGYLLAQEHWGKGYASELIQGLLSWCETIPQIQSIIGGVATDNKASIRVLEKNGFETLPSDIKDTLLFQYRCLHKFKR